VARGEEQIAGQPQAVGGVVALAGVGGALTQEADDLAALEVHDAPIWPTRIAPDHSTPAGIIRSSSTRPATLPAVAPLMMPATMPRARG
jgi:hypothetical protein